MVIKNAFYWCSAPSPLFVRSITSSRAFCAALLFLFIGLAFTSNASAKIDELQALLERATSQIESGTLEADAIVAEALRYADGADSAHYAASLFRLGQLLQEKQFLEQAEVLYRRILAKEESPFGPSHSEVAADLWSIGNVYVAQDRYDEALALYQRTLTIQEEAFGPNHTEVADTLWSIAEVYYFQNRLDEALGSHQRALDIREDVYGPDHPDVAQSLWSIARVYAEKSQFEVALELYQRALLIQQNVYGAIHQEVSETLWAIARVYYSQGLLEDALNLYQRVLEIEENIYGPDHPELSVTLYSIGRVYEDQDRFEQALTLYQRSLEIDERFYGPSHSEVAADLWSIGNVYVAQDRYDEALALYQRTLTIQEEAFGPNHTEVADTLWSIAEVYYFQNRLDEALGSHQRALDIREDVYGPDHPDVAQSLWSIARVYAEKSQFEVALELYQRALLIQQNVYGAIHQEVSETLWAIARVYYSQGLLEDALNLYQRVLEIEENIYGPDHPELSVTLYSIGRVYEDQDRFEQALTLYQRSLEIDERFYGPSHSEVAADLWSIGNVYVAQDRYDEALALYQRTLTIQEEAFGPNHTEVADTLWSIAEVYYFQNRLDEALGSHQRALDIREDVYGPDHPDVAHSLWSIARVYAEKSQFEVALELYGRSLAITEHTFGLEHPDVSVSLIGVAVSNGALRRYSDALDAIRLFRDRGFSNGRGLLHIISSIREETDLITSDEAFALSLDIFQSSYFSEAAEAYAQLAARFAAGEDDLASLVRRSQDLDAQINALDEWTISTWSQSALSLEEPSESLGHNVDFAALSARRLVLSSEQDEVEAELLERYPDYVALTSPPPVDRQEVMSVLEDDEAFVAISTGDESFAWVITLEGSQWAKLPLTEEGAQGYVQTMRDGIATGAFNAQTSYELYGATFGQFEKDLEGKAKLYVYLTGALTSLPLQVLVTEDPTGKDYRTADWMVRSYAIANLPSINSLLSLRADVPPSAATKPLVAFADPVFDRSRIMATAPAPTLSPAGLAGGSMFGSVSNLLQGWGSYFYRGGRDYAGLSRALPALPWTRQEVRLVGNLLGADEGDLYFGLEASPEAVRSSSLDDYRVVYFATHALVGGELESFGNAGLEPALALSFPENPTEEDNGLLFASDIAQLDLDADWVVLSACNTASGDVPGAEALSGMARAFIYAGARSLLASHWEVEDAATAQLMTSVFSLLEYDPGLSKAEALQRAELQMIQTAPTNQAANPKRWAPFISVSAN